MGLIVGVDGGGTKSTYKVYNQEEDKIYDFEGSSINFYSVGDEKACNAFVSVINTIQNTLNKKIVSAFVGNAALGIGEELADSHPFPQCVSKYTDKFKIVSDLYIGLKGIDSTPSIFLISGTGSMGIAEDKTGNLFTIGGWGQLLGDQGSGYYIGLRGMKEAVKAYDGISEGTVLVEKLTEFFSVDSLDQIIEKVYNPLIEKHIIAKFATSVTESAENGDKTSLRIIDESVDYLVRYTLNLHDRLGKVDVNLGIYGGCFQKSEIILNKFKNSLSKKRNNIKIDFPKYTPVEAALICACDLVNVERKLLLELLVC
jgi:glucosamine kinase